MGNKNLRAVGVISGTINKNKDFIGKSFEREAMGPPADRPIMEHYSGSKITGEGSAESRIHHCC